MSLSAAKAIQDHLRDWYLGTDKRVYTSMGFVSDGNYDIPRGIVCSRPVICLGDFKVKFVNDLTLNQIEKLGL